MPFGYRPYSNGRDYSYSRDDRDRESSFSDTSIGYDRHYGRTKEYDRDAHGSRLNDTYRRSRR